MLFISVNTLIMLMLLLEQARGVWLKMARSKIFWAGPAIACNIQPINRSWTNEFFLFHSAPPVARSVPSPLGALVGLASPKTNLPSPSKLKDETL